MMAEKIVREFYGKKAQLFFTHHMTGERMVVINEGFPRYTVRNYAVSDKAKLIIKFKRLMKHITAKT